MDAHALADHPPHRPARGVLQLNRGAPLRGEDECKHTAQVSRELAAEQQCHVLTRAHFAHATTVELAFVPPLAASCCTLCMCNCSLTGLLLRFSCFFVPRAAASVLCTVPVLIPYAMISSLDSWCSCVRTTSYAAHQAGSVEHPTVLHRASTSNRFHLLGCRHSVFKLLSKAVQSYPFR